MKIESTANERITTMYPSTVVDDREEQNLEEGSFDTMQSSLGVLASRSPLAEIAR